MTLVPAASPRPIGFCDLRTDFISGSVKSADSWHSLTYPKQRWGFETKYQVQEKKTHSVCIAYYLQLLFITGFLEHNLLLQLNSPISLSHHCDGKIALNHREEERKNN